MPDKCEHRTCHCHARLDSEYCSVYCETAIDDFDTGCRCGHPECRAVQGQETQPPAEHMTIGGN